MPVIPEDIWMYILQIGDEAAFWITRTPRTQTGIDWSLRQPTSFASTQLKPVSTKFSKVCSRWRKVVLNTGTCWVTTVNSHWKFPLSIDGLATALGSCSKSDIDVCLHGACSWDNPEPDTEGVNSDLRIFLTLIDHSPRWRSFIMTKWGHAEIFNVVNNMFNEMEVAKRLISLDIGTSGPRLSSNSTVLLGSRFPALSQLHINSSNISLGSSADLPQISRISMNILDVTAENLLQTMSNSAVIESLIVTSSMANEGGLGLQRAPPVIMGPIPPGLNLRLPHLVELQIHIGVLNVLPFLLYFELPSLAKLDVNTGASADGGDILFPVQEQVVILPSLLTLKIRGRTLMRNLFTVISHMSMPCLTKLWVCPGNFDTNSGLAPLLVITLPSLQSLWLEGVSTMRDFGFVLNAPVLHNLKLVPHRDGVVTRTFCSIPSQQDTLFATLHTLNMEEHTLAEVDWFLCHHALPSLTALSLAALSLTLWYENAKDPLPDWATFLERQRAVLGNLKKFEPNFSASQAALVELLAKSFPHLASPPST